MIQDSTPGAKPPEPATVADRQPEDGGQTDDAASADAGGRTPRSPRSGKGLRTQKAPKAVTFDAAPKLADDPSWQTARLFSISGVGTAAEQEKRATSALLSTLAIVKPFARAFGARVGAPAGAVETFLEVQFTLEESRVIPDGLIRVVRGSRRWTGLLEVKTGTSPLRPAQVENYLEIARGQGFDTVVTLSNEIAPGVGEHPLDIDLRRYKKVGLIHLSWAEVLHEAKMVLQHQGVEDATQAWILAELIRYLEHPRSGVVGFDDMGPSWVAVRNSVAAGTLRATDRKVPAVADAWLRLTRQLGLRLSADLGVAVKRVGPVSGKSAAAARTTAIIDQLVTEGALTTGFRVPGAAGPVNVIADLRTSRIRVGTAVPAPQEGTSHRRAQWMLRQLKEAPDDLLVEVQFARQSATTCEQLADLRSGPGPLLTDQTRDVTGFVLTRHYQLGSKRSGVKGAFIPSVFDAVESFYSTVLQPLRTWVPPAPKLAEDMAEDVSGMTEGTS